MVSLEGFQTPTTRSAANLPPERRLAQRRRRSRGRREHGRLAIGYDVSTPMIWRAMR